MHGTCLGVVCFFLNLWICVPGPWNISAHLRDIDKVVLSVRPTGDVTRRIGPVSDFSTWKASECRQLLLFFSVVMLSMYLPERYFQHWLLLAIGVSLLLSEKISNTELAIAENVLNKYNCFVFL